MSYAELHALSNFTFLRGASHPEELVETATALGYEALAITDECTMSGIVRAHTAAKEHGLGKLIIGSELHLRSGRKLVALAQNRHGYAALCDLITRARRAAEKARETGQTITINLKLNSYDRRLVHLEVSEVDGVDSQSEEREEDGEVVKYIQVIPAD